MTLVGAKTHTLKKLGKKITKEQAQAILADDWAGWPRLKTCCGPAIRVRC